MTEQQNFGLDKPPEEVEKKEHPEVFLEGLVFKPFVRKGAGKKGKTEFRSSAPDRKIVVLKPDSPRPEAGKPYRVKIIEDTNLGDPMGGKFIAELYPFSLEEEKKLKELASRAKDLFDKNDLEGCRDVLIKISLKDFKEEEPKGSHSERSVSEFKQEDVWVLEVIEAYRAGILNEKIFPEEIRKSLLLDFDIENKFIEITEYLENLAEQPIRIDKARKKVVIGSETTPIWEDQEKRLTWELMGEQFRDQGETMVEVYFRRSDGVEIRPGSPTDNKIRFQYKDRFMPLIKFKDLKKQYSTYIRAVDDLKNNKGDEKSAQQFIYVLKERFPDSLWILRSLRHLNNLAGGKAEEVKNRDPYFVENEHVVGLLQKFTRLVNIQLQRKQGILILEGDAGAGKNKLADHFAYLTRRPLFRFTCSAGKDEQDFKYLLEYDSKRGTYRIKSSVIEALETPGAILEFDEINTLKPEIAKSLNSLFDYDRTLYMGEDRHTVTAAEGVIILGLQNPQHYVGVQRLAETILSRARLMEVPYPPLKGGLNPDNGVAIYRPDEAMILRLHVPELADFSGKDFKIMWNFVVNGKADTRVADLLTLSRAGYINDLKEIVVIANKTREAYRAYHQGTSGFDEPVNFIFSLRESVDAAYELLSIELTPEEKQNLLISRAKKAVGEVVLPKISDAAERLKIESLITNI